MLGGNFENHADGHRARLFFVCFLVYAPQGSSCRRRNPPGRSREPEVILLASELANFGVKWLLQPKRTHFPKQVLKHIANMFRKFGEDCIRLGPQTHFPTMNHSVADKIFSGFRQGFRRQRGDSWSIPPNTAHPSHVFVGLVGGVGRTIEGGERGRY